MQCGYFDITLLLWHQQWLVGDTPSLWNRRSKWPTPFKKRRLRPISTYNVSTVKIAKKSSIMTNIKSTTGFPASYRWSAYVTTKARKGGLHSDFIRFLNNSQLQSNKVCYKVSLCENFERQSCSTTIPVSRIPYPTGHNTPIWNRF